MDRFDRTTMDETAKGSWEETYHLKSAAVLWSMPAVPFVEEDVVARFRADGAKKVLDLPCGDGRNTLPLVRAFEQVVASDASTSAMEIARRRLADEGVRNVSFREADIFHLPFADGEFDVVLCWDLIGHLTEPAAALTELLRVVKPGGLLTASIFSEGDSTLGLQMEQLGPGEYLYKDTFYFHFYDRAAAQALGDGVGTLESLDLTRWTEPPHEGYREYEHEHESWALTFRKPL